MRLVCGTRPRVAVCNETRPRRYGYQFRCLELPGHHGEHRWTSELVVRPARPDLRAKEPLDRTLTGQCRRGL
jgi:hypothetical protein